MLGVGAVPLVVAREGRGDRGVGDLDHFAGGIERELGQPRLDERLRLLVPAVSLGLLVGVVDGEPLNRVGRGRLVLGLGVAPEVEVLERVGDLVLVHHRPGVEGLELAVDRLLGDPDAPVAERLLALRTGLELVLGVLADEAHLAS